MAFFKNSFISKTRNNLTKERDLEDSNFFSIFSMKFIKAPNWVKTSKYLQISKECEIHTGICEKTFLKNYKENNVL